MLILRRISEKDSILSFITGNEAFFSPSYRLIGKNKDKKWGDYFLASRVIKFKAK